MPNNPLQAGFQQLTPQDMQDPSLTKLNQMLRTHASSIAQLFDASQGSGTDSPTDTTATWLTYQPTVRGNGLAVGSVTAFKSDYLNDGDKAFVAIDINFLVSSGSGTSVNLSLPVPPQGGYGTSFACNIFIPGTGIAGVARIQGGLLVVSKYNQAAFATGAYEVIVSGFYRV